MGLSKIFGAVLAICLLGSSLSAATVSVTFQGSVQGLSRFDTTPYRIGDRFSATIQFSDGQAGRTFSAAPDTGWVYEIIGGTYLNERLGGRTLWDVPPSLKGLNYVPPTAAERQQGSVHVKGGSTTRGTYAFAGTAQSGAIKLNIFGGASPQGSIETHAIGSLRNSLAHNPSDFALNYIGLSTTGSSALGACSKNCRIGVEIDDVLVDIAVVPVPAALPLMGLGVFGLGLVGRRRKV